ncbi:MAG TPA: acyltransferase, partial [Burkholderiaceae bacterium]
MKIANNFDGVRLVAALSVLVSHQFVNSSGHEPLVFGSITVGTLAVLVFFAMSGYLVASSWAADPTAWRFAARRFLRIWPAYAVVITVSALWFALFDPRPLAGTAAWIFVTKRLFFQPWDWAFFPGLRDPRLNASLWTIPFEAGCYVAFLVVAVLARKWWPHFLAVVCGLAFARWAHGMAVFNPSHASFDTDWVFFGALFAFGAV